MSQLYATVGTPVTSNQTDIKFVTESSSANSKSTISGFTASDLSSNAAFVNVSFTNSENKIQRAAFFSTTLFIQIGAGNDNLPLVDKIDIWADIINNNVILTTANVSTTNTFNIRAERVGDDVLRLKSKISGASLTTASSLTDSPDNFAVELSDNLGSGTIDKRFEDIIEIDDNSLSESLTVTYDKAGTETSVPQASGETLEVKRQSRIRLEDDVLYTFTK